MQMDCSQCYSTPLAAFNRASAGSAIFFLLTGCISRSSFGSLVDLARFLFFRRMRFSFDAPLSFHSIINLWVVDH
jgi:hypothetical protein